MNGFARLFVTNGLHSGASIPLAEDHDVAIGSDAGADLVLLDPDVMPFHVKVRLRGEQLSLHVVGDSAIVFGRKLKQGAHTLLGHGAVFSLSGIDLLFSNGAPLGSEDTLRAERAWLRAHAPLAWLRGQIARAPRYGWITLACALILITLALALNGFEPDAPASSRPLDRPAFRHVRVHVDKATGTRVYEGYVQTPADLGALSLAARTGNSAVTIRVTVIDAMQEQLSDFLDKYYRGAQLRAAEPGTFIATLPPSAAYLLPDSWDYARVAKMAQAGVDGLQALRFAGHENGDPVRIPMEALGLNLMRSPHGAWLADPQGMRYFIGAQISIGRIERIGRCSAAAVRDDGSIVELIVQHTNSQPAC